FTCSQRCRQLAAIAVYPQLGALRDSRAFHIVGVIELLVADIRMRPYKLNIVQAEYSGDDLGDRIGNSRISIIREHRPALEKIAIDGDAKRFLDLPDRSCYVHKQAVRITPGYCQSLRLCPVDDGLLVRFRRRESGVPFLCCQEVAILRTTRRVQSLK